MGYDPNQPRAPKGTEIGGQWVKAGEAARAAAREQVYHDQRDDAHYLRMYKSFHRLEGNKGYESGWALNEDGNLLSSWDGDEHGIMFSEEDEILLREKAAYFVHNHPGGGCFSSMDLIAAADWNLKEMVATTDEGLYRMTRKDAPRTREEVSVWADIVRREFEIWTNEITGRMWPRIKSGEITKEEATELHYGEMWSRMKSEFYEVYDFQFIPWEGFQ